MSTKEKSLVMQVQLEDNTYYITDRYGIELDGNIYKNTLISVGKVSKYGNIGDGASQVSNSTFQINNGAEVGYGPYVYPLNEAWNKRPVEVRLWESGIDLWDDCQRYAAGTIGDYKNENEMISGTIEVKDNRDSKLMPQVKCELQTAEQCQAARIGGQAKKCNLQNPELFDEGDLIKFENLTGDSFYAKLVRWTNYTVGNCIIDNDPTGFGAYYFAKKPFDNLPDNSVGKTIPIQIGDFTDTSNGKFGKTVTINNKVGSQSILFDSSEVEEFNNLGIYEQGLQRYFTAFNELDSLGVDQVEYSNLWNHVEFRADTLATLNSEITTSQDGVEAIAVSDYTKIIWLDEESSNFVSGFTPTDLLSVNILAIDNELFQIVEKPTSNTIFVERGFNNTTPTTHSLGSKIYQSAKFSVRNLLFFREKFNPTGLANFYLETREAEGNWTFKDLDGTLNLDASNVWIGENGPSKIIDSDTTNYGHLGLTTDSGSLGSSDDEAYFIYSFDLKFPHVERDLQTIGWYGASKTYQRFYDRPVGTPPVEEYQQETVESTIIMWNPNDQTLPSDYKKRSEDLGVDKDGISLNYILSLGPRSAATINEREVDFTSEVLETPDIEVPSGNFLEPSPGDSRDKRSYGTDYSKILNSTALAGSQKWESVSLNSNYNEFSNISLTTLRDLNKKWKVNITTYDSRSPSASPSQEGERKIEYKIYQLGFWVDIIINFIEESVNASLKGRNVRNGYYVTGGDPAALAENPADVLALLLIDEGGYQAGDFELSSWQSVYTYLQGLSPIPKVAFSYGVDDKRVELWDFLSEIGNHFNVKIFKNQEGLIDIISMWQIYFNTPAGFEVDIDEIKFVGENRLMTVRQTGSDLLYNDYKISYKRNNATNEYQAVYTLPQDYVLKSGVSIRQAREKFSSGRKRTLEISSPYIYNEDDARRHVEFLAEDNAEIHMFIDFQLDYDHYKDKSGLTSQYKIGQIFNLNGYSDGYTFTSSNKFYIQNIYLLDKGHKIQIQAKSIDRISDF